MEEVKNQIIKKLSEYDIEIFDDFKSEDNNISLVAKNMIIVLSEKNKKIEAFVSFFIETQPSYSARIILLLKSIKGIKNFMIGSDFLFDNNGNFLDDKDAIDYREKELTEGIISNFVDEQYKLEFLKKSRPFHC